MPVSVADITKAAFSRDLRDKYAMMDAFDAVRLLMETDKEAALRYDRRLNELAGVYAVRQNSADMFDIYEKSLLLAAKDDFDFYLRYIEKNRAADKRFYMPRRKQLRQVVQAMQELSEHKITLLAVSLPPGTGKTSLALFYLTWLAGKHPELPILTGSHNNAFLAGAYGECLRIFDPNNEYLWHDVFPDIKVISTNAKDMLIDVGHDRRDGKRFATLEFSSVGSGNAGKVRAAQLLYCDDLVDGLESALSRERMDKLWAMYTTDLRQRKIGDCVELHIATRWSVHDVIGRLEQNYAADPDAKFITIPALDENDQSNFDYAIAAGFSTEFYHRQREIMDDASWRALYMNEPIEREGQLYPENELRRYFELPDGEPDAILTVCDTKDRGTDYCVMPVAYQYGNDYYIEDVICDNSAPDVVEARLINILLKHNVQMSRFESNSAGGRVAEKVQQEVKKRGGRTKITTKYTTANKETKIIMAALEVKEHFLFKDASVIKEDKEYRRFLSFLTGYTMAGKNKFDDVPDAMAMLVNFTENMSGNKVEVIKRFW